MLDPEVKPESSFHDNPSASIAVFHLIDTRERSSRSMPVLKRIKGKATCYFAIGRGCVDIITIHIGSSS